MIEPFRIEVPAETIASLHRRLENTRWPTGVTDSGGMPLSDMRDLVNYWLNQFDWSKQEQRINQWPHFRVRLGGQRVHFIHIRAGNPNATPLLLLHGWPGSFIEMMELIPLLTGSFHLVIPSLPGFGFSDAPSAPGMSNERIASIMADLMSALQESMHKLKKAK